MKILLLSIYIMIVGCSKGTLEFVGPNQTVIDVKVSNDFAGSLVSDDNYLFEGEYRINTVRILAFDGEHLDRNQYISSLENITGSFTVKMLVNKYAAKNVYVIVNEPSGMKLMLDNVKYRYHLDAIEYSMADYFNELTNNGAFSYGDSDTEIDFKFKSLPMSGFAIINTNDEVYHPITVHRTLARLDVWLRAYGTDFRLTPESLLQYNTTLTGNIFETKILPTAELITKTITAKDLIIKDKASAGNAIGVDGNYKRAFTFYTPERTSLTDDDKLRFTVRGVTYLDEKISLSEVVLTEVTSGEVNDILRNNVYSVYCTIKGRGIVSIEYEVTPWEKSIINLPPFE